MIRNATRANLAPVEGGGGAPAESTLPYRVAASLYGPAGGESSVLTLEDGVVYSCPIDVPVPLAVSSVVTQVDLMGEPSLEGALLRLGIYTYERLAGTASTLLWQSAQLDAETPGVPIFELIDPPLVLPAGLVQAVVVSQGTEGLSVKGQIPYNSPVVESQDRMEQFLSLETAGLICNLAPPFFPSGDPLPASLAVNVDPADCMPRLIIVAEVV